MNDPYIEIYLYTGASPLVVCGAVISDLWDPKSELELCLNENLLT